MITPEQVWAVLRERGEKPATVQSLLSLYQTDRDYFCELACIGVTQDAPTWARELATLAAKIRSIVRGGFEIIELKEGQGQIKNEAESVPFEDINLQEVANFLAELNGTSVSREVGNDFEGTEISEAEVRFRLGDRHSWEADQERVAARMNEKPLILRLDNQDQDAVASGMPAYVVYGLLMCATRVVQAPTAVFEGIRREGIFAGRAFAGRPNLACNNDGSTMPSPEGMVYLVYANDENFVFDWDWVKEDPQQPGFPMDWQSRFERQLERIPEATLAHLEGTKPGPFDRSKAWYSPSGDCAFWYFSDDIAYAKRINDDLTIFKSLGSDEVTGCKLKNVKRILEQLRHEDEEQMLFVVKLLAQSLIRQADQPPEVRQNDLPSEEGYGDLIKNAERFRPTVNVSSVTLRT